MVTLRQQPPFGLNSPLPEDMMKDLTLSIWNIFRGLGRVLAIIRNGILNTFLVLLVIGLGIRYFTSGPADIPPGSILKLSLVGDIVEERRTVSKLEGVVSELLGGDNRPSFMVLQDILDIIETAAFDPQIDTILLDLSTLGKAGLDQLQTIGHGLEVFRHQNKKVIAAQDFYTQHQYYLASYADTIIVNPMGGVELHGFGSYSLYFKEMLDKLEVNYHIFRVGDYKAAIEPITRTSMSDEARSQSLAWLETLWSTYTADVGRQRGMKRETLDEYVAQLDTHLAAVGGDMARLAQKSNLVDMVLTREGLHNHLIEAAGFTDHNLIETATYLEHVVRSYTTKADDRANIGIIIAEGNMVGGDQPAGLIGSESLGDLLRKAREDDSIKGVVLRVNTAGGSAFAAEVIRQELLEVKKAGKPVVISMGSMAASGGYWISADANQIWASPVTLTGSIGIFGAIPTFERSLASLGIYSDGVGTTPIASGLDLTRPLKPEVKSTIQLTVNNGYARFLDIVANGRNIDQESLPKIAEGRVFSGQRAMELGLVDRLGTLNDAIGAVAELIGTTEYRPVYIEQEQSLREQFLARFGTSTSTLTTQLAGALLPELRLLHSHLSQLFPAGDPQNVYAHAMLQLPR